MIRIIVGGIAWFGFGIILAEIMNNFGFLNLDLEPVYIAGFLAFVFLSFKLTLGYYEQKSGLSKEEKAKYKKLFQVYEILIMILGVLFSILIPFLWFGVIRKLAAIANGSGNIF